MEPLLKIIHISDLHIGMNKKMTNIVRSMMKGIVTKHEKSSDDIVFLVSGDIPHMNKNDNITTSKEIFNELKIFETFPDRVLCCPGNHDSGWLHLSHKDSDNFFFTKSFPCLTEIKSGNTTFYFVGLDSAVERFMHFSRGKVGKRQLKFLSDVIKKIELRKKMVSENNHIDKEGEGEEEEEEEEGESSSQEDEENLIVKSKITEYHKLVVYLHHDPFMNDWRTYIRDKKDFLNVIRGKCDVLVFGHQHDQRRMTKKEKEYNIPVILCAGMFYENDAYREINFFEDGSIEVEEVFLKMSKKK